MQIAKPLGQFENSVFVIVGNKGEYTPYRYIPLLGKISTQHRFLKVTMLQRHKRDTPAPPHPTRQPASPAYLTTGKKSVCFF